MPARSLSWRHQEDVSYLVESCRKCGLAAPSRLLFLEAVLAKQKDATPTTNGDSSSKTAEQLASEVAEALARADKGKLSTALTALRARVVEVVVVFVLSVVVGAAAVFKERINTWVEAIGRPGVNVLADRDLKIRDLLVQLRSRIQADRVYICLYQDSPGVAGGQAIKRFSCVNEVVGEGVSYEQANLQQVPLPIIADIVKAMATGQEPIVTDVDSIPVTSAWRAHLKGRGVRRFGVHSLRNHAGAELGFMAVDWTTNFSVTPMSDEAKACLRDIAERAGYYLFSVADAK